MKNSTVWSIVGGVVAVTVVLGGLAVFAVGEDLFGSDNGSIDSYNREVLESCDVPDDWTLVRTYIAPDTDRDGVRVRTMSYVWASPQTADEAAAYVGVDGPGIWATASATRSCKFGQRPSALVLEFWSPGEVEPMDVARQTAGLPASVDDEFWAGAGSEITDVVVAPAGTSSFVRLRVGQRVFEGIFGLSSSTVR